MLEREVLDGAHAHEPPHEALEQLLAALRVCLVHAAEVLEQKGHEQGALRPAGAGQQRGQVRQGERPGRAAVCVRRHGCNTVY